ncbi:Uncharacterised protein [Acinetobacter baumannii]|nr:Uncharacterised protein [Acinetobacter baumannii]
MSVCTRAAKPATNKVTAPVTEMNCITSGASSNTLNRRQHKYTPAVTIVAAWINAETGVGPAIASANHVCNGICADLPAAPKNNINAVQMVSDELFVITSAACSTIY